jgi:putative membrane protein
MPLPTLNACLNFTSAVLLSAGFYFIKRQNILAHKIAMGLAFLTSSIFLGCYLYYHYHAGSKHYAGTGSMRTVYFSILISHTILAAAIVPMILTTLARALRGNFAGHVKIARWTWPLWMYVSVTGVVIYWMLYQ